jgi:hypothetical protein
MFCKKSLDRHQVIVVAVTRDHASDAGSRNLAHYTREILAPGSLMSGSRRRPDGAIKLIDLERRARFARLSPEIA